MQTTGFPATGWRMVRSDRGVATWRRPPVGRPRTMEKETFLWTLVDLMTLLLVFFILLYANAVQRIAPDTGGNPDMAVAIESPSRAPDQSAGESHDPIAQRTETQSSTQQDDPSTVDALGRQMLGGLGSQFDRDFYIRWEDRVPVIVLGERITFDVGDAVLLSEAQDAIGRVARAIAQLPDCQVLVTGHTDDRPIRTASFPSNWELSAARAASVARALMDNGVAPDRLLIQGQSKFKPVTGNDTADNRRANRRVEISLITVGNRPQTP